jgi:hypothetical protein
MKTLSNTKRMVGRKGKSGGARKRSVLKDTVMIGARVSRDTAAWLRAEAVKRIPAGRSRPDIGVLIEEIVSEYRNRRV